MESGNGAKEIGLYGPFRFMRSVKYRMIFAFSLLFIGAMTIVQAANYYQFINEIEHSHIVALVNSLQIGIRSIETQFLDAESFGISIMAEDLIQQALTDMPDKSSFEYDIMLRRLSERFQNHIRAKTSIHKEYLINTDGEVLDTVLNVIPLPLQAAMTMGYPQGTKPYVTGVYRELYETTRINVLSLIRRIYRSSNTAGEIGFLVMDIDAKVLQKSLEDFELPRDGYLLLLNAIGEPVFTQGANFPEGNKLASAITGEDLPETNSQLLMIEGVRYMCLSARSDILGWHLAAVIPYSIMMQAARRNRLFIFILLALCIIIAIVLSSVIISRISKPITLLLKSMKEVEGGNFHSLVHYSGGDEMQQVVDGYNSMTAKMEALLNQIKKDEEDKRNAELYALQAQINPHFLYNALNSIRYLAREKGVDDIGRITASLINLSRASLDSDKFITIKQEMALVEDYVEIMKIRYGNIFRYHCEMEPDLSLYVIPRFSVQPLVENAVFHGILPKEGGNIMIRIVSLDGGILIEVEDTGVGIGKEDLKIIESQLVRGKEEAVLTGDRRPMKNIGLKNIDGRIKRYFSEGYGLSIISHSGEGTVVRIKIPRVEADSYMQAIQP
jgi:two-component system sensor histidine kinase YesM